MLTMRRMAGRRMAMLALLLLLCAAVALFLAFQQWRAGKVAMLQPPALAAISVEARAADAPPALLLFGDSRIAHWRRLPERPYPIHGEGHPGWTAIRLVPRFEDALRREQPSHIIVQLGVNDAVAAATVGAAAREQALADSLAAIQRMARAARMAGAQLTVWKVMPPVRPDLKRRILFRDVTAAYVDALNAGIEQMAASGIVQAIDPMDVLTDKDGRVPERFRHDSLHFTPEAYDAMGSLLPLTLEVPA